MELPSQEGEIPIPLNSSHGGGGHGHSQMIHHDHNNMPSAGPQITPNGPMSSPIDDHIVVPFKKMIRYKECLKNHAASMGGTATDGCGEFMPSGEEGSLEALTCSVCNCHRNFHRKEIEGERFSCDNNCYQHHNVNSRVGMRRPPFTGHHHSSLGYHHNYHSSSLISSRTVAPPQMIMPYSMSHQLACESDYELDHEGGVGLRPPQMVKKRFRTKFTQEQKDKMLSFAEKVGWKIQKQEDGVVQQFCQEIGIKRRVLKVWMHNNKNNLAKKNLHTNLV